MIDYNGARQKVNELNRTAIVLVDMLNILEAWAIGVLMNSVEQIPLTQAQKDSLANEIKDAGDHLKYIAGEIKTLVS